MADVAADQHQHADSVRPVEPGPGDRLEPGLHPGHLTGASRWSRHRQAREPRMLTENGALRLGPVVQARSPRRRLNHRGLAAGVILHQQKQFVLRTDVAIERHGRVAERARHPRQADRLDPVAVGDRHRRRDHLLDVEFGLTAARGCGRAPHNRRSTGGESSEGAARRLWPDIVGIVTRGGKYIQYSLCTILMPRSRSRATAKAQGGVGRKAPDGLGLLPPSIREAHAQSDR